MAKIPHNIVEAVRLGRQDIEDRERNEAEEADVERAKREDAVLSLIEDATRWFQKDLPGHIRKAVASKQDQVYLGDGTIGEARSRVCKNNGLKVTEAPITRWSRDWECHEMIGMSYYLKISDLTS